MKPTPIKRDPKIEQHAADVHVGGRIRELRVERGLTQQDLARGLGLTFQQVQKYENGSNRVGAGRLYLLAGILGVDVAGFYAGLETGEAPAPLDRGVLEIVKSLKRIDDPVQRAALRDVAKAFAKAGYRNATQIPVTRRNGKRAA